METFAVQDLTFAYPESNANALDGVTLTLEPGTFCVLCGPSGCGKTTLLRQLKPALAPHGVRSGAILFRGQPLEALDPRTQAAAIGFVQQDPETQIVTDKVWHELAFGLESLGVDTPAIRRRVAEMASFFGIQTWFHRNTADLSGGQKQLLNLAAVMVLEPEILILDEPTSQLDPIAAGDFLAVLGKINRELGTTILLTEHRLEEVLPLADRAVVMDRGRVLCQGTPSQVGQALRSLDHPMFRAMPTPMRVWAATDSDAPCPVTVREGRDWLTAYAAQHPLSPLPPESPRDETAPPVIAAHEVWFRYEKQAPDVVRDLSLEVKKGELLALLGGNGAGKTTTLKLLSGLETPYRGELQVTGKTVLLPQNPQALFVKKTLREDLTELLREHPLSPEEQAARMARSVRLCRLEGLLDRHPYDLSGGERQRAALAKALMLDPEILLLDEPTKGLDAAFKEVFGAILQDLIRRGVTVLIVSHDLEFCARHAHRCALFFDGSVVADGSPRAFFSGNRFYTTAANRMARPLLPQAVTPEDLMAACGGQAPPDPLLTRDDTPLPPTPCQEEEVRQQLPRWRKALAFLAGGAALLLFFALTGLGDFSAAPSVLTGSRKVLYGGFLLTLFLLAGAVAQREPGTPPPPRKKTALSRRFLLAAVLILLLIPVTLFAGEFLLGGRKYYFIALLILLETMLPFFLVFEGRRPQARELVLVASLCAIGVAGRAVFFMLPSFKPVLALTIIAGVALGGETGFLVGAMTMLVSNILFSQGPWTPWQMFAAGIIGFLAGFLYRRGLLRRSRTALCVFGALAAILIYGGIMNSASALMWAHTLDWKILLAYWATGFPIDCVHAAATWLFLWFAAEPFLEKLDRIKVKYGLLD
ncbi:MAG: ATP-binding cassette domain-containing protein [Bacillota bacterium]|nr:ATP-binding cassette domain-containing protein [Bacillota bacterium]